MLVEVLGPKREHPLPPLSDARKRTSAGMKRGAENTDISIQHHKIMIKRIDESMLCTTLLFEEDHNPIRYVRGMSLLMVLISCAC
mmetsp:Transcript_15053/g.18067  ORF Transcript_15053/g.18067 Transcript_15053/m.18067 type:complete len:85 (-) Transcript_15053:127-381(-)